MSEKDEQKDQEGGDRYSLVKWMARKEAVEILAVMGEVLALANILLVANDEDVIYQTASRLAGTVSREGDSWKSRMEGIQREYNRVHNGPPEE